MSYQLNDINFRTVSDPKGFIEECDALYREKVSKAADRIIENMERSPIVLLSGPSGSGKTTTAMKICEALEKRGIYPHTVSMDDYFKTIDPQTAPRTPEGNYDLESPLCMDMDLLNKHFTLLSQGKAVDIPKYDFRRQAQLHLPGRELHLGEKDVAVFEGIHALNDTITNVHPEAFKLYISARSNILDDDGKLVFKGTWMRLMRRTVRDYNFRGTGASETLAHWANIRRGEKLHISPFKDKADLQFDSSFAYEVPVMNNMATELFTTMPPDTPRYSELMSILPAFELFEDVSPDLLRPDSLLREFVGGGIYKY